MLQKSTESSGDESEEYEQVEEVLGLDIESDENVDGDNEDDDDDEVELAGEILVFCLHVYYKMICLYVYSISKI